MLAARLQSGQPTAGEFYELTAIAAVILGGASLQGGEGTLYKSVIGVFIMIVLGNASICSTSIPIGSGSRLAP